AVRSHAGEARGVWLMPRLCRAVRLRGRRTTEARALILTPALEWAVRRTRGQRAARCACTSARPQSPASMLAQFIQAPGIASSFSEQAQSQSSTVVFTVRITHTALRLRWALDREGSNG